MPKTTHERVGDQSIRHYREFDATAEAIERAHTDAALFARWMGPVGTRIRFETFEPVTGGSFRYSVVADIGEPWTFFGSYHSVEPGRIVHAWQYEGETDATLESLQFSDLPGGRSKLEITSVYLTREACDEMVASGLDEGGMDHNFERLDALLTEI